MAGDSRRFDPSAVDEFITFLQEEIDTLQTGIVEHYFKGDGALGRMPAFGVGGDSDALRTDYTEFYTDTWGNLQGFIATYTGFIDTLEAIKETNASADEATAADFDGQL